VDVTGGGHDGPTWGWCDSSRDWCWRAPGGASYVFRVTAPEPPRISGTGPSARPWLWIGLTAFFALLAIALGIWGFSKKSDLDDARADEAQLRRQLGDAQETAEQTETQQQTVEAKTKRAYRKVRRRFVREKQRTAAFRRDIRTQRRELAQARQQVANATTDDERRAARLKAANEQADVAAACARGALDSIDRFFEATDPDKGANAAVASLQDLQGQCQDAVGASVPENLP
jgi:hypothetical protein